MENMKLYEIDEALEECFDQETGEIIDMDRFEALNAARHDKIEGVGCIIKNRAVLIESMKQEKARLTDRIAELENRNEATKNFLDYILAGQKFETAKVKCAYRKSTIVEITDEAQLPEEFLKVVTTAKPDKTALKDALKNGEEVPGCQLVEHNNLSVK